MEFEDKVPNAKPVYKWKVYEENPKIPKDMLSCKEELLKYKKFRHPSLRIQEVLDILILKIDSVFPYFTDVDYKHWSTLRPYIISIMSLSEEWRQDYNKAFPNGKSTMRVKDRPLPEYKRMMATKNRVVKQLAKFQHS